MMCARRILVGVTGTFCALVVGCYSFDLHWNYTPSMPVGLWRFGPLVHARAGEIVDACVPLSAAKMGLDRGYLGGGNCPGGAESVLKTIAAGPGDEVVVSDQGTIVNGKMQPHSKPLPQDDRGRKLEPVNKGVYFLGSHEVWLIGTGDPRSYDSRYYGPVDIANLRHNAEPVIVRK